MNKKKLFAMMALVIVIAILGTGTLAYFTTRALVHNVITTGGVNIELEETMLNDKGQEIPFVDQTGAMPGQEISKIVRVTNKDAEAWIRIQVEETIDEKADSENVIRINYNLGTAPTQWTEKDGWYYYNKPLANGETTEPLFKGVTLAGREMDNKYQNKDIVVSVSAQAVQAANNAIPDGGNVTDVKGWPKD